MYRYKSPCKNWPLEPLKWLAATSKRSGKILRRFREYARTQITPSRQNYGMVYVLVADNRHIKMNEIVRAFLL